MHHFGSGICSQIRCRTGSNLHDHAAGHDHQVAWRGENRKDFGAEPGHVVPAGAGRHQLDAATGCRERHRPQMFLRHQLASASSLPTTTFSGLLRPLEYPLAPRIRESDQQHGQKP